MLTPKQKAVLKGLANSIHNRYQIGKGDIDENIVSMLNKALESHELIKVVVLPNSAVSAKDSSLVLSEKLPCDVVQVVGRVIVLYRKSKKDPKIVI